MREAQLGIAIHSKRLFPRCNNAPLFVISNCCEPTSCLSKFCFPFYLYGASVAFEDIPAEDCATAKARVDAAVQRERAAAREARRAELRKHIEHRAECLRAYPIGQKLVYTVRDGRTVFVRVVSYSRLGKSVRVRAFEKTAVETWVQTWPQWNYGACTMRRTFTLYRAKWDVETDVCYTVSSNQLGMALVKGSDYSRPIEYNVLSIQEVEQATATAGAHVINIRSTGGRLWASLELTPELTVPMLKRTVANTLGLMPSRGSVSLCHGETLLGGSSKLGDLFASGPLEITATILANQSWPVATDGRAMPYGVEYLVCSEDLAFESVIDVAR
jgi:hypothetical protein